MVVLHGVSYITDEGILIVKAWCASQNNFGDVLIADYLPYSDQIDLPPSLTTLTRVDWPFLRK